MVFYRQTEYENNNITPKHRKIYLKMYTICTDKILNATKSLYLDIDGY